MTSHKQYLIFLPVEQRVLFPFTNICGKKLGKMPNYTV